MDETVALPAPWAFATDDGAPRVRDPDVSYGRDTIAVVRPPRLETSPASLTAIPGFEIEAELGRGARGVVHAATQRSLRRTVALKAEREIRGNPSDKSAFLGEARLTAWLEHPNIVPVHALRSDAEGAPVLVMKRCEGESLRDALKARRVGFEAGSPRDALTILKKVCDAVAYAHSRGIAHCDLKPENVMLGPYGEVLVVDWGLAHAITAAAEERAPAARAINGPCGTPRYIPPELARGDGGAIGPATDVYLIGGLLLELLSGAPPHPGDTLEAVLRAALKGPELSFDPDTPAPLIACCRRALAHDPRDRHDSVEELRSELLDSGRKADSEALVARGATLLEACKAKGADAGRQNPSPLYFELTEATACFRQALALWPENAIATRQEREARLALATAALAHGDHALAGSTLAALAAQGWPHQGLEAQLSSALRERRQKALRWALLRGALVGGLVALFALGQDWRHARDEQLAAEQAFSINNGAYDISESQEAAARLEALEALDEAIAQGQLTLSAGEFEADAERRAWRARAEALLTEERPGSVGLARLEELYETHASWPIWVRLRVTRRLEERREALRSLRERVAPRLITEPTGER